MAITTLEDLQKHLRWAVQLEHTTLAPYLYAYYSCRSVGTDRVNEAARVIRDVVIEEMLHLALAANVYNALGGPVLDLTDPAYFPTYPAPLPHHDPEVPVILHLERASRALVGASFLAIEKPEAAGEIPEGDRYGTIGQFYRAIQIGLEVVNEFPGDRARQVSRLYTYGGGRHGHLIRVVDLFSATLAIREIVDQGEGSAQTDYSPEGGLAHYWQFSQIADGSIPLHASDVYPLPTDPTIAQYPPGPVQDLARLFSDCYSLLLRALNRVYVRGDSDELVTRGAIYTLMDGVLAPIASTLAQTPVADTGTNAGPTFERSTTPRTEVCARAEALVGAFPRLQSCLRALNGLPVIDE